MIQANIPANKAVFSSFKTKASFLLKERPLPLKGRGRWFKRNWWGIYIEKRINDFSII